jgi:hypothetical protein
VNGWSGDESQTDWDDRRTGERLLALGYRVERIDGQTARLTLVYVVDGWQSTNARAAW